MPDPLPELDLDAIAYPAVRAFIPHLLKLREQDQATIRTLRAENHWLQTVRVPTEAPAAPATWPGVQQILVVERRIWITKQRLGQRERVYGITRLTREEASPADLLRLARGHWRIETQSHWVRDVTFGEDTSLVRRGEIRQVLAVFRAMAITRFRADGVTNVARETRRLAAQAQDCLRLLGLVADD